MCTMRASGPVQMSATSNGHESKPYRALEVLELLVGFLRSTRSFELLKIKGIRENEIVPRRELVTKNKWITNR